MPVIKPLHKFLRAEFEAEEKRNFSRLRRVPDTHVRHFLDYYTSLNSHDQDALADAATMWGTLRMTHVDLAYEEALDAHPAWKLWRHEMTTGAFRDIHYYSVPSLRASAAQAKIDRTRLGASTVPKWLEDYAASIKSVKAPELRRHVRAAFSSLIGAKPSNAGGNWDYSGNLNGSKVTVYIDYGGQHAQLGYEIAVVSTEPALSFKRVGFETALAVGFCDWNFIVEENLEDAMLLLSEFVRYASELPKRLPDGLL